MALAGLVIGSARVVVSPFCPIYTVGPAHLPLGVYGVLLVSYESPPPSSPNRPWGTWKSEPERGE